MTAPHPMTDTTDADGDQLPDDPRPDVFLDDVRAAWEAERTRNEPGTPDTSSIDFLELLATPIRDAHLHFEQRVAAVVSAVAGLDRRGVHRVLDRAGSIARARAER